LLLLLPPPQLINLVRKVSKKIDSQIYHVRLVYFWTSGVNGEEVVNVANSVIGERNGEIRY
jgi:hypothetical protein